MSPATTPTEGTSMSRSRTTRRRVAATGAGVLAAGVLATGLALPSQAAALTTSCSGTAGAGVAGGAAVMGHSISVLFRSAPCPGPLSAGGQGRSKLGPPWANSCVASLPSSTAPDSYSLVTVAASCFGT